MIKIIIVYTNKRAYPASETLLDSLIGVTDLPVKVVRSHAGLQQYLSRMITTEAIIVYQACDKTDLQFICSIRKSVKDTKLVLILPDDRESSFSDGLLAFPRYITYLKNDFSEVAAVIEKILNHERRT